MNTRQMNVLLTGATGGIGRVIATELVKQGASILLTSHLEDELIGLKSELEAVASFDQNIEICASNLLDQTDMTRLVEYSQSLPFSINVLINNAGMMQFGLFADQDPDHTERVLRLNTIAPMMLIQQLVPVFKQLPQAQILNIGSTFGSIGYPGFVTYSASKSAIQGFSESLKRELKDTSVAVKYLSPRATQTDLNPAAVVAMNKALKVTMDQPELVAKATLNLLNSDQSSFVMGWPEKLFVKINKLFPAIVDRAIANQLPIIKRYATNAY